MTTEKEKDVFKFLSYLSILFLYNSIIFDLGLETYTLFSMLGYVIIAMLTLRTILIKYIDNIDIWEYIVFGLIYLTALSQYNNESDGMLFGILLVIIVITSYIKKYGALFMVNIFAILLNIFVLTREFWFSVPWWIYLLTVGTILIGFAIRKVSKGHTCPGFKSVRHFSCYSRAKSIDFSYIIKNEISDKKSEIKAIDLLRSIKDRIEK